MDDKLNILTHKINQAQPHSPSPFSNNQKERTKTVRLRYSLYKKVKIKAAVHDESITDLLEKAVEYAAKNNVI